MDKKIIEHATAHDVRTELRRSAADERRAHADRLHGRRSFLRKTGLSALALTSGWAMSRGATGAPLPGASNLTPAQLEGPFYFDDFLTRRNIVEGLPGLPMRLDLTLVRGAANTPIPNADIIIWHTEGNGAYAGYAPNPTQAADTRGRNYCRGTQVTDAAGKVSFDTIYPGFYVGRTAHIHAKVIVGGVEVLTTQFYMDDKISDEVYGVCEPYRGNGARQVFNHNDGIYDRRLELALQWQPGGIVGSYTICIR